ncbi:MAG TPA: hypothetical protein GX513_13060, partial [Firmicutes bacterium]|nr:hypothetical protein [Bacillota bacterium]
MRPKVALVLPGRHLQELAEEALKEMGEEATVYPGPEFHPERVVGRARREGALVLVAPPPISRSLRQVGTLPVVELEPTSFELVEALLRAREAGKPIALFHFGKAGPDEATLTRLAGARVSCLALPKDAGEVHQKLLEVGREGAVVVGGRTTVELASRLGIPGVAVVAGKAAIVEAVQRARAVLAAMPAAGSETEAADLVPPAESAGDVPPGAEAVAAATRQDLAEDAALPPWEKVVALSEAMAQAVALADQIATSSAPALIWGELGA